MADLPPGELFAGEALLEENRLVLPPLLRMARELGLPARTTPEGLAAEVLSRAGERTR